MMKSYLPLVILVVSLVPVALGIRDYMRCYEKIEAYLTGATKSDDMIENLELARKFYNQHKGRKILDIFTGSDHQLVEVARHFADLDQIYSTEVKCSTKGVTNLIWNDSALGDKVCSTGSTKTRVESILYRKALEHAGDCRQHYAREATRVWEKLGKSRPIIAQLVDLTLETFYGDRPTDEDPRRFGVVSIFANSKRAEFVANTIKYTGIKNIENLEATLQQYFHACYDLFHLADPILTSLRFDEKVLLASGAVAIAEGQLELKLLKADNEICLHYVYNFVNLERDLPNLAVIA